MATSPLGGSALPFNIPAAIDAVKAIDAEFWRRHGAWRLLEDEYEASPYYGDDPEGEAMLDLATEARDAMFLCGVWTAPALLAKLEACEEGGAGSVIDQELHPGVTVFQVIKWDCERIFKRDAGLCDPLPDAH